MSDVTQILSAIVQGDQKASEQLLPLVYEELRKLAAAKNGSTNPARSHAAGDGTCPRGLFATRRITRTTTASGIAVVTFSWPPPK